MNTSNFFLLVFERPSIPRDCHFFLLLTAVVASGQVSTAVHSRETEREGGGQIEAERDRGVERRGGGERARARANGRKGERDKDRGRHTAVDHLCPPLATMAKSSKKQCRTRKPPRQGGGLVVVSQRDVLRVAKPGPSKAAKKAKGKKKKISSSSLAELMASGDGNESDDFDTPLPTHRPCSGVAGAGGINEFIFASSQHSLEQRLYYLLATRPAPPQQPGEVGSTGGTPGGAGGVGGACASASAGAAMEGGCHALVFVETTAAAQELVGELKALGLVVFALHERTPKAQVTII